MVEDTQKRYADDVTVQELVRLRVENERLREALHHILKINPSSDNAAHIMRAVAINATGKLGE